MFSDNLIYYMEQGTLHVWSFIDNVNKNLLVVKSDPW